jgi:hypothetical protein
MCVRLAKTWLAAFLRLPGLAVLLIPFQLHNIWLSYSVYQTFETWATTRNRDRVNLLWGLVSATFLVASLGYLMLLPFRHRRDM